MKKHKDSWVFRYYMAGLIHTYLEKKYEKVLVDIYFCKNGKYGFNIRLLENSSKEDAKRLMKYIKDEFDIKDCHLDTTICLNWIYGRMSHDKLENIQTLLKMKGI